MIANASAGNADAILAGLLAITLVATLRALTDEDGPRLLPLAALFAAAAVLTKNEGLLGTVAILAAAAIVTRRRAVLVPRRRRRRRLPAVARVPRRARPDRP